MTKKKLIIIIGTIILISFVSLYSVLWFKVKNEISQTFSEKLSLIKKKNDLKELSYNIEYSCFPLLCINVSNIKAISNEYTGKSKKGLIVEGFNDSTLTYKITSILNPHIKIDEENISYDFAITNLDNNKKIHTFLNSDKFLFDFSAQGATINLDNTSVSIKTEGTQEITIADLKNINISNKIDLENKQPKNISIKVSARDFILFDARTGTKAYALGHLNFDTDILNLPSKLVSLLKKQVENGKVVTKKDVYVSLINSAIENKTEIKINDLKITDTTKQVQLNGNIFINEDMLLDIDAKLFLKFYEKSLVESLLLKSEFVKQKSGHFDLNIKTNNKFIEINNKVIMPTPAFSSAKM